MENSRLIIIRSALAAIILTISSFVANCQYYYKDLVTTSQINQTFKLYRQHKVTTVALKSYQGNDPVNEGFLCEQKVNLSRNQVITYTRTADAGETFFTATYNSSGLLIRTIDSSQESVSTTTYIYDALNRLQLLNHTTHAADNSSATVELHTWQYEANGKPIRMVRMMNGADSTIVDFTLDEKGNVSEEQAMHKKIPSRKVFYYYDEKSRLTDVVRFSTKAKRLLPDYIFEYEDTGELSTLTIVPEGSTDYQKWYYKYDEKDLKVIEFCYNKKQELLGKVEYNYSFASR